MTLRVGFNARALESPHMRGLTRYTVNLLKALSAKDGIELFLFSDRELPAIHLKGVRAEVVVIRARRETLWEAWALPKALRSKRIDVFHAPADRGLPLVKLCPCVVTVHNSFERNHWRMLFPSLKRRYWYWKNELTNKFHADAVITVSDTTRQELATLGVASERQLRRVYLAPAPEFTIDPLPSEADVLIRYGIFGPYLLYVGGYDEHKNVEALVRAFDMARLRNHCLVIVARQQGGYRGLIERWRNYQCFDRLKLIEPPSSDIPSLYRQAQFFVNPSRWESFSFQLVEAMACGTPLLASDCTAIPEIALDAALYFDPTDIAGMASLMIRLAEDSMLRAELRKKGLVRVRDFSWELAAEETMEIYREVSGRSSTAQPSI